MRKPLIYYVTSTFMGCMFTLLFFEKHYFIAALLAAFFLISILYTVSDYRFIIVIFIFFIMGTISYHLYFNNNNIETIINVRVMEKKNQYLICSYKGKQLMLLGNMEKIKEGQLINISGSFERKPNYLKGIIGIYNIKYIFGYKEDFMYKIYAFKRNLFVKYSEVLGSERAGIVVAACFGDVTNITKEDKQVFNRLGIIHVISVSGFHLALIYKVLENTLGIWWALFISLIYTIFTGALAPTVRAFIMILIFKLSKKVYKNYDPLSSWSFSALLIMLWRPYYISDIGFLLSFLSVLGIFLFYEKLKKILFKLPTKLNDSLSLSISAQFFAAPIVITALNTFSMGFVFGNLFLLPIYSLIVILGNIMFLFYKLQPVFKVIGNILSIVIIALEGGKELILIVSPPISYITYNGAFYIILIYISYIFYVKGYRQLLYLPLIIIPLLISDSYKIVPEIQYLSSYNHRCLIVKYKNDNLLIYNKKDRYIAEDKELKSKYHINKIYSFDDMNFYIKIGSKYTISKLNSENTKLDSFTFVVSTPYKNKIITEDKSLQIGSRYNNYDIIFIKPNVDQSNNNQKYSLLLFLRIIFGGVLVL